jgi:hypothetical protein
VIFFSKKKGTETQNSVGEGGVIPMPGKRFRKDVPACILLRKKIRNGVPSQIPLEVTPWELCSEVLGSNLTVLTVTALSNRPSPPLLILI